jgi:hypothetical protein
MAAWNAHVSNDGVDGTRNLVGNRMFSNPQCAYGEVNQGNGGRRGQGPHKRHGHPPDPRARDLEHVRGAEGLRVKGRGQPGGNKPCKKVPAVRQSLFGHLDRSNSLRDGDKPGNFFSEVSESVFPMEKIGGQRNHQEHLQQEPCQVAAVRRGKKEIPSTRRSRPSWSRSTQCEPCQAATVWRGKKRKGQRDHQVYLQ